MTSARRKSFLSMVIATIIFIFGITAGMSFAYFSDTATATNTLSFGKLKIALSDDQTSGTTTITLTPNATDTATNKLAVNDTITLTGLVGLEENSVPAYIRVKVELYETSSTSTTTETKVSAPAFVSGFLTQMQEIKQGSQQWFKVGNYLYYGNAITTSNTFAYSASNTNETKNVITITDEMLTDTLKGKSVKVKLIYQAIQASGAFDSAQTFVGYTQDNATTISTSKLWTDIFGYDLAPIYSGNYYNSYVRGNLNNSTQYVATDTKTSYDVYTTDTLTSKKGAMSPFAFFEEDATGDYIAFGYYPQTIVSDEDKIDKTKTIPFNGQQYYKDSDGYLYVKKTARICVYSGGPSGYKYSDETSATSYTDYYFKLEPIIWKILSNSNEQALLYSVSVLTAMVYYGEKSNRTIGDNTIYANNYEYSYIRAYLNGLTTYGSSGSANGTSNPYNYNGKGLLQQAFTSSQVKKIPTTTVDNSSQTTDNSSNSYACATTNDKIFLLSYQDLINNNDYGFNTDYNSFDVARMKLPTDYAIACGAYKGNGLNVGGGGYWLRSPSSDETNNAWFVDNGSGLGNHSVNYSSGGVVPALFLNLS